MSTASFKVRQSALKTSGQELRQYRNMLQSVSQAVKETDRVMGRLKGNAAICRNLSQIENKILSYAQSAGSMALTLENIADIYGNTEKNLTNGVNRKNENGKKDGSAAVFQKNLWERFWDMVCSWFGWGQKPEKQGYEIDSVVFDDEGSFGGDQGSPKSASMSERQELYGIVRKYFPEMSDKGIADFLKKLNSEGCSYVATVNTVFAVFEGREAEFENKFGFPMYKNGDLNYDELLVDFYCETDNHNKRFFGDYMNDDEDPSPIEGNGATPDQQAYRAEKYLREKGIEVELSHENVTTENFKKYSEKGYVVLYYYKGEMENANGRKVKLSGGHAMTITGVTDDGRFIVSSWGEKYYVDPSKGRTNFVFYQYPS